MGGVGLGGSSQHPLPFFQDFIWLFELSVMSELAESRFWTDGGTEAASLVL